MSNIERYVADQTANGDPIVLDTSSDPARVICGCRRESDTWLIATALNTQGAVSLTDEQWERVLWWLHKPVPPGPAKDLDVAIIRSINHQRGAVIKEEDEPRRSSSTTTNP